MTKIVDDSILSTTVTHPHLGQMTQLHQFRVKIIKRPEGGAPVWVRDAWMGVEFPILVDGTLELQNEALAKDVVTGEVVIRHDVVRVSGREALKALEKVNEAAARWWYVHTLIYDYDRTLLFGRDECQLLPL